MITTLSNKSLQSVFIFFLSSQYIFCMHQNQFQTSTLTSLINPIHNIAQSDQQTDKDSLTHSPLSTSPQSQSSHSSDKTTFAKEKSLQRAPESYEDITSYLNSSPSTSNKKRSFSSIELNNQSSCTKTIGYFCQYFCCYKPT